MKRIIANEQVCMGCGLCEVYCTVQHSKSKDIVKAYNKETPRPISRVRLAVSKPVSFANPCRHCEDAPCVTACPNSALTVKEVKSECPSTSSSVLQPQGLARSKPFETWTLLDL